MERVPGRTCAQEFERAVLPEYLLTQRWFGAKGRRIASVQIVDAVPLPLDTPIATFAWLKITYPHGNPDLYLFPLAIETQTALPHHSAAIARLQSASGEAILYDALADPRVCKALLDLLEQSHDLETQHGRMRFEATSAFNELRGNRSQIPQPRLAPPTSSNSLVFYGDRLLLKLFRRLELGVNPDYEIGRVLTEQGRFDRLPRVAGAIEYYREGSETPITLGIVQQLIPNDGDGWHHALDDLARFYERVASRAQTVDANAIEARSLFDRGVGSPPSDVSQAIQTYARAAKKLGSRTAEMHLALSQATDNPAFEPEPISSEDVAVIRREILAQAERAFALLDENRHRLSAEVRDDAEWLLANGFAAVENLIQQTQHVPNAVKTRVHGDYHLGQVLWTNGDYVILDFEGEPTRTIVERRAKFSPLRDVAGMLRSYHYAAYAGLFACTKQRPDLLTRLLPWAEMWQRAISTAFLTEYRLTAGDAPFIPKDEREFASLLDGFMLAKALYELSYELNNRPSWVRIPLGGVMALLQKT